MTASLLRRDNFSGSACWLELEFKWITVTLWKCPSYSEAWWGSRPPAWVQQSCCGRRGSCPSRGGLRLLLPEATDQPLPYFLCLLLTSAPWCLPLQCKSSQGCPWRGDLIICPEPCPVSRVQPERHSSEPEVRMKHLICLTCLWTERVCTRSLLRTGAHRTCSSASPRSLLEKQNLTLALLSQSLHFTKTPSSVHVKAGDTLTKIPGPPPLQGLQGCVYWGRCCPPC